MQPLHAVCDAYYAILYHAGNTPAYQQRLTKTGRASHLVDHNAAILHGPQEGSPGRWQHCFSLENKIVEVGLHFYYEVTRACSHGHSGHTKCTPKQAICMAKSVLKVYKINKNTTKLFCIL